MKHKTKRKKRALAVMSICFLGMITFFLIFINTSPETLSGETLKKTIVGFERKSVVFSDTEKLGTSERDVELPETIRGIVKLTKKEKKQKFVHGTPVPEADGNYSYFDYGYVDTNNETGVYTVFIQGQENSYRVFGSLGGKENQWYVSDENGNIINLVKDISVKWSSDDYQADIEGTYEFTGEIDKAFVLDAKVPIAEIIIQDIDEQHSHSDEEHNDGDLEELDAEIMKAGSEAAQRQMEASIPTTRASGNGTYDKLGDNYMLTSAKTSGNANYTTPINSFVVPGTWRDYVNTIWMNKAANEFSWNSTSPGYKGWKYSGVIANQTTGTTTDNPKRIPTKDSSKVWTVYSGEQLRYALTNFVTNDVIKLGGNLDMDGGNANWVTISIGNGKLLNLDGNNFTIYNLGIWVATDMQVHAAFVSNIQASGTNTIKNLTFSNVKAINSNNQIVSYTGLFSSGANGVTANKSSMTNVHVKKSMFYSIGDGVAPFGARLYRTTYRNCSVSDSFVYGRDHVSGLTVWGGSAGTGASTTPGDVVSRSYSVGTLLATYGGHSGMFFGCASYNNNIDSSFTNNEMYATMFAGGFMAESRGKFTNNYATGKLEGFSYMGGFTAGTGDQPQVEIDSSYSTVLVGLRKTGSVEGGFQSPSTGTDSKISNSYAAGEVGNFTTNMTAPVNIGGFLSAKPAATGRLVNNYYDKQTTGMREWATGADKVVPGITGLLTSTTTKSGTGMASGNDFGLGTANWSYQAEHYPELKVFSNASEANWGSAEQVNIVKANSLASVSTVMLNTWDKGYDWDNTGIRSEAEVSYDRTPTQYRGGTTTYDTVREIVTNFKVTSPGDWQQIIPGGAPVDTDNDGVGDATALDVSNGKGTIKNPGLDWYQPVQTVDTAKAKRPIRLVSYMEIQAGEDAEVSAGILYNHREDVELRMMDSITEDLVIGFHDDKVWSSALLGDYPNSDKFWKVKTDNMLTQFSASKDALLYTEISLVKRDTDGTYLKDSGGNYLIDKSVKVTGAGTGIDGNPNLDEQKWNGDRALYADNSAGSKYIVTYYWQLTDGRYRTDEKIIDVVPAKYDTKVDVFNSKDNSANEDALAIDAKADVGANPNYVVSGQSPAKHTELLQQPFGTNVTTAWGRQAKTTIIDKLSVTFKGRESERNKTFGEVTVDGPIVAGKKVIIPVYYSYPTLVTENGIRREVTKETIINLEYEVKEDSNGDWYISFNKVLNYPNDLSGAVGLGLGDSTGIEAKDGGVISDELYIDNIEYNMEVKLWVSEVSYFNIRQVVLKEHEEVVKPLQGYFELRNEKSLTKEKLFNISSQSTTKDAPSDINQSLFKKVKFTLTKDSNLLKVLPTIPEYYEYVGHIQSTDKATLANDHLSMNLGMNAQNDLPVLDYIAANEYWVTIYIQPKLGKTTTPVPKDEESPRPYSWSHVINEFNKIKK
ncbi:hypothetical protein I6N95_17530 [Vagococcus sp. BWB3-3]|uniref:GLUG domain-containing protein n=1 Tax=Vagococcus allomyrinae TaxID=2794353 RepID=A0A940SX28_9ENTE|nr:hypothetical protein [Vagococcus allomyrinae]MBP1042821.1 hypothetical protein [Vagococcus allomyrinae]